MPNELVCSRIDALNQALAAQDLKPPLCSVLSVLRLRCRHTTVVDGERGIQLDLRVMSWFDRIAWGRIRLSGAG